VPCALDPDLLRAVTATRGGQEHVHPGCPHGFDRVTSDADVVRRARADRLRALAALA
jgi:hypothetical protein